MAKSIGYYGLRRGSTKSHTYSVLDGQQITKDRVEGGMNPRTFAQMAQRCVMTTVGNAYSAMKSICDHSFEEYTAGRQCMRKFMSENLKQLQICKEYGNDFFGFNHYKEGAFHAGSYIISKGSLPAALVDATIDNVDVASKKVTLTLVPTINGTIPEVAEAMGCKFFYDLCTVALMYPKADGSYGFGAVRFTYKNADTVLNSFTVAVTGDAIAATPTFTSNTLKVEVRFAQALAANATTDNTYMAALTSRFVNGVWHRSTAQFDVQDATPTFALAIATYPVGKERFLNGSYTDDVTPTSSSESGGSNTGGNTGGGGLPSGGSESGD